MNIIEEVRLDREDLARVLKKHAGIRKIVEDLYPDSAHFIYELLQNAEDTGATETKFILTKTGLVFEHNGRPFESDDLYAITDIGAGTKGADEDKIGRFGIGFKAVFAYTETPRIWSPTYAFEISELVLPSELSVNPQLGEVTRFEFPFNNPKKSAWDAYTEVAKGLDELSETTLLFLSSIESIEWELPIEPKVRVLRIQQSEHHIELLKQIKGKKTYSSHFLLFSRLVAVLGKQYTSIAFALDFLPSAKVYTAKLPLAEQFRIVPAKPGHVAVFFPAEKETSGLRFHLHAPFVPELSRASIKETPANVPLFRQLRHLASSSLYAIRDLKLLTRDFLAVLPNPQDNIPDRYKDIRRAIIYLMKVQPLTPTYSKGFAPADDLLQAKASLKTLFSVADLEFLVDYDENPPKWAIGATQKNSEVDRFLTGLDITEWDIEQFVCSLDEGLRTERYFDLETHEWVEDPDKEFIEWLSSKPEEWHQKLYATLYRELEPEDELWRLEDFHIVRLSTGEYSVGNKCYFPTEGEENDDALPRVSKVVYTSGKSKTEKDNAKRLLEEIGVREVGEAEHVEAILKERYTEEAGTIDKKTYYKDLKRFIALVEKEPECANLFKDYWIFECVGGCWGRPNEAYLDAPYHDTGLSAYYEALGDDADRVALSESYINAKLPLKRFVKFAEEVGIKTRLVIKKIDTRFHTLKERLHKYYWKRRTYNKIDVDWFFPNMERLLAEPSEELSKLFWRTLMNTRGAELVAQFRPNKKYPTYTEPSSFVLELIKASWIPQKGGKFVPPIDAVRDLLPTGFPFDPGWSWVKAIHFGQNITERNKVTDRKREVAKELGFKDDESLDDAKWFAGLDFEERQQFKREHENKGRTELPEHESGNPGRRSARVSEQANEAPERITEKRTRSVSVGREAVKKDAEPYLRQQYTNNDGEMICQVCKAEMPFKLEDGSYYFETVEFLPELGKRHYQNYLALCPNHSAMYRHANGVLELINELFSDLDGNELEVVLADEDTTLYFTKNHISDLKEVIATDDNGQTDEE